MAPNVSNSYFTNYYDVLHLPRDATKAQIRLRFKKLSLLFHPDKNKDEDAPRMFRSIKTAEEILMDNNKKAIFDRQLNEIDNFLRGGSARAASASAARTAAQRDAENRARDQRHYERDRARAQQNNASNAESSSSRPQPGNPFTGRPQPKWNQPKPPRPDKPREDIYMQPQYKPSGRQPPWSIFGKIPRDDSYMPWGKTPIPVGSKNPFNPNPFTGGEIPAHGHFPLNPADHCYPKIEMAWPIVHNEGYRVLRGCSDLYKNQWKDAVKEAAIIDIKSDAMLEEGMRRIEYMFHKFAEYVWTLLTELPHNMVALLDPDAAMEKLEQVMFTLQEFCNRAQRLPMAIGFLAQGIRQVFEPPEAGLTDCSVAGRLSVLRNLNDIYETFMGEQREPSPEEEL
jgi:curved DNA-binding protein CbpA